MQVAVNFRRFVIGLTASILLTAGWSAAGFADGNTGTVRGYVRTANANEPVCGVRVFATSNTENVWSTLTDEHGFFVFLSLFPGVATVSPKSPRGSSERNVQVSANLVSEVTLYVPRLRPVGLERCARTLPVLPDRLPVRAPDLALPRERFSSGVTRAQPYHERCLLQRRFVLERDSRLQAAP